MGWGCRASCSLGSPCCLRVFWALGLWIGFLAFLDSGVCVYETCRLRYAAHTGMAFTRPATCTSNHMHHHSKKESTTHETSTPIADPSYSPNQHQPATKKNENSKDPRNKSALFPPFPVPLYPAGPSFPYFTMFHPQRNINESFGKITRLAPTPSLILCPQNETYETRAF